MSYNCGTLLHQLVSDFLLCGLGLKWEKLIPPLIQSSLPLQLKR